eukprot:CAMPEP_0175045304 /NCGR_PEP_ID=MMETSP0052_2-20121109/4332_1 /TAXON_ID=51329 ORGANISM="Polytomella parva, Strain SAG 63-3" /NCGR_SAMPLE_ID=MMETSP0052_2 /ASSEMBLY_ACC=CAM_ASM_000194 /LENGTH=442 /DNA_ID=CAMNT_0016308787 /DNA_START=122 /DNA_END=1450 /DNA_ORIENTATION=+
MTEPPLDFHATASEAALRLGLAAPNPSVPQGPTLTEGSALSQMEEVDTDVRAIGRIYEELESAAAIIAIYGDSSQSCFEVLKTLVGNVLAEPGNPKYASVKLNKPKVKANVIDVPGALEFLMASGFTLAMSKEPSNASLNSSLINNDDQLKSLINSLKSGNFPSDDLDRLFLQFPVEQGVQLQTALHQASLAARVLKSSLRIFGLEAPQTQLPCTAPQASVCDSVKSEMTVQTTDLPLSSNSISSDTSTPVRDTEVILPVTPDVEVPEWFFSLTGAEIKFQYTEQQRRRAAGESFQWRRPSTALEQVDPSITTAVIRVRFPEGVCIQSTFTGSEPVSSIFEWVRGSLRDSSLSFELVGPDRAPVSCLGTPIKSQSVTRRPRGALTDNVAKRPQKQHLSVFEAGLTPSVLLNFRALFSSSEASIDYSKTSFLSDFLLRKTKAA